ncbi:hypothetical protein CEXT_410691 [Caerostris extrusa]|uniref:Uncharacterized protein n=1 Tax=Caerostris extrusa TaxID=172846 RepID=A0AAV4RDE1_CAEEX|nr:hypothetical protein CEXT_410691 [Caerostris extrusa]
MFRIQYSCHLKWHAPLLSIDRCLIFSISFHHHCWVFDHSVMPKQHVGKAVLKRHEIHYDTNENRFIFLCVRIFEACPLNSRVLRVDFMGRKIYGPDNGLLLQ